jgi:hypothetical protein
MIKEVRWGLITEKKGGATRCIKMIVFEDNGVVMVVKGMMCRGCGDRVGCS